HGSTGGYGHWASPQRAGCPLLCTTGTCCRLVSSCGWSTYPRTRSTRRCRRRNPITSVGSSRRSRRLTPATGATSHPQRAKRDKAGAPLGRPQTTSSDRAALRQEIGDERKLEHLARSSLVAQHLVSLPHVLAAPGGSSVSVEQAMEKLRNPPSSN